MQRAYIIFFLFISQFVSAKLFAQQTVYGSVVDSLGQPIQFVNVRLIANDDTSSVSTGILGEFKFANVKSNYFIIAYSMIGYKAGSSSHYFLEGQQSLKVPNIILKPFTNLIPSVNVVRVVPMSIKGDTVQFNFGAYDFRPTALLEEALRDLPGFQVYRDGLVTFNGHQIKKVRVDNKDFFGGDLLTATRNLPADFIKNIQLIDANTIDNAGVSMNYNAEDKVLNINLKEDKKKIYFGQVTLGGGTNNRYLGSFGLNKFNEGQELSILGSFNNTNTNLFTFGSPFGGNRERSLADLSEFNDPIDGLNKVSSLGFSVSDKLSKVINFSGSYNYTNQRNHTVGSSQMISSFINNSIFRSEDYTLNTEDKLHKVRFAFDMNFLNKDILKIDGNLFHTQQLSRQNRELELNSRTINSYGLYQDSLTVTSPNAEVDFSYSKYFKKAGRKLIGHLKLNSNSVNRNDFANESYYEDISDQLPEFDIDFTQSQLIIQRNHTYDSKLFLTYVEPFTDYSLLEISYDYEITSINSFRAVEDRLLNQDYRFIDSLFVNYNYTFNSHKVSMAYQFEPNNKFKMNVGLAVQPLVMKGYLPLKSTIYKYDNVNLIPTANLIYKFSKESDWQLNYKGKNNQPHFSQIAPVIDNTNSRNILIGNPELKSEYSHRIATTFRKSRATHMQYFELNAAYNFVLNKIVSSKKTSVASTIQETTFKNTSGYYDWRLYYTFSTPLVLDNIQLDLIGTSDYFNNLSYIDDKKRTTRQLLVNQSIQLKYEWSDYFESLLNANYTWNQAKYDIPFKTKIDVKNMFLGLGFKGYLNNWTIGLDMSQRFNDGYKNKLLNVNQTLMNSYVELAFLRNKSAFLRLQVNDLFNQNKNSGIVSEYIGNDVYEARNNRLGRYLMLSLNVRLQKLPK